MSATGKVATASRRTWVRLGLVAFYYFIAAVAALALVVTTGVPVTRAASGNITGTVYHDYNESGTLENTAGTFVEDGVGGVTVRAFDSANTLVGTTATALNGTYTLAVTGAADNNIRVEFDSTTFPKGAYPSHHGIGSTGGTGSGTTVAFTTIGATKVDMGLNTPTDFCKTNGNNPNGVVTPCYYFGDPTNATVGAKPAILNIPYTVTGGTKEASNNPLATVAKVGTVWGVTYQPSSDSVFASAFQKRHAGYGPLGTGGIYRITNTATTPTVSNFVDLNSAALLGAGATGADPHPTGTDFLKDVGSFDKATKISLGGLTISGDGQTLYTINLATRELISIGLGTNPTTPTAPTSAAALNTIPTATQVGRFTIPTNLPGAGVACAAADVRPFAVKYHEGLIYVGLVCSNQGGTNSLEAYVYTYDPVVNAWATSPALEFPLTYTKGATVVGFTANPGPTNKWNNWTDTFNDVTAGNNSYSYPEPILSDINFYNEDMVVALRDRLGDQGGHWTPKPDGTSTPLYEVISAGDILRATPVTGSTRPSQWKIENNAAPATGTVADFAASAGAGNNQGPGGGEFYYQDDYISGGCCHQETSNGGLGQWAGKPEIVMSQIDPIGTRSGGLGWYNHVSGVKNKAYEIYPDDVGNNQVTPTNGNNFEKSGGLGGIAMLCDSAPLEIGNRVWVDSNGNGVQDAGEPGLSGITVTLYDGATAKVSVTTNANGEYFFDSSNVPGGLLLNHNYTIKLDKATDYTGTLANYQLTKANITPDANHTATTEAAIDSNALPANVNLPVSAANFAQITMTTGLAGQDNHTYDFGFAPNLRIGNLVWKDTNNNGIVDAGESGISGVTVNLILDANGNGVVDGSEGTTPFATASTDGTGHFYFTGLPVSQPGQDYLIEIPYTNFANTGPLAYLTSSTGGAGSPFEANLPATLSATNQQDHGVQVTGGNGSEVISRKIVLATGTEPTGDEGAGTDQPTVFGNGDTNSDLAIDFGFTNIMRIGNLVWKDDNNNGSVDIGETGIAGVAVNLYLDNGDNTFNAGTDTLVGTTTTDANGHYLFTNVTPGKYFVQVDSTNFNLGKPLNNFTSSTDVVTPGNNQDHGQGIIASAVSNLITLTANAAPTGDEIDAPSYAPGDNNSDVTIDFGFKPAASTLRIGNFVWKDANNNGIVDAGEVGVSGVTVDLILDANGNGVIDAGETTAVASTTTDSNGYYYFNNLTANTAGQNYLIRIPASNFTGAGKLVGLQSSTGGAGSPLETGLTVGGASSPVNNEDHGRTAATGDVVSQRIVLTNGTQPTGDETDATPWASGDTNSNLTIDFGFILSQRLGNFVWNDLNNNGVVDAGESGIAGVKVNLYLDNGNGSFDGTTGGDTVVASVTTDATGHYEFDNVAQGNYFVEVDSTNFTTGPLVGYASSSAAGYEAGLPSPSSPTNNVDHGKAVSIGGTQSVVSSIINLTPNGAPGNDEADAATVWPNGDVNSNLTLDFGFNNTTTQFRIGNYIFLDGNKNGTADTGDTGIAGVKINLLDGTGTVIATTTTDSSGHYYFANLAAGSYRVQVDATNFNAGGVLNGYSADATNGTANNQDHGTVVGTLGSGGFVNGPLITLAAGTAPTGDETDAPAWTYGDANSNSSQDFGFGAPTGQTKLRIGNYVWADNNNNGALDTGEPGIANVKVNLILDANGNGVIDAGETTPIATATTDSTGHYEFDNLNPSTAGQDYLVQIDQTNFNAGGALANLTSSTGAGSASSTSANPYPFEGLTTSSTTNNVDHGNTVAGQGVVSAKLVLTANAAPTGDEGAGQDAATYAGGDTNSNMTIDFGFIPQMRIGNLVWQDNDNNGVVNAGEPGISGVKVNLLLVNGDGSTTQIGTTNTDGTGRYYFNSSNVSSPGGLLPGKYIVQIDQTNFNSGAPLQNRAASSVRDGSPTNNTNDGAAVAGNGVQSHTFSLVAGGAPTGDENDASSSFANGDNNSQLSVDFGFNAVPTGVQLAYFNAKANGDNVEINWTTATEVDNLGFNIYFKPAGSSKSIKLNAKLVASRQITGRKPQNYSLTVKNPGEGAYFVEAVGSGRAQAQHGPFKLGQTFGEQPTAIASQPARAATRLTQASAQVAGSLKSQSFDLLTDQAGLYHLTYEYLTSLGMNFNGVTPAQISLSGPNGPVNLKVVTANPASFGPGDYIEWQATTFHNIYTDYNTYVLTTGPSRARTLSEGASQSEVTNALRGPIPTPSGTPTLARIKQNSFYWESADSQTDPWFWDYLATFDPSTADKQFSFDLPNVARGGQATGVKVYLRGFMGDPALSANHKVHAWLNGQDLGSVTFNGTDGAVLSFAQGVGLNSSGNTLRLVLESLPGASQPYDLALFDRLEFTYPQATQPTFTSLAGVRLHLASPLSQLSNSVDYLIITHPAFMDSLQPLVQLHRQEGLKVKVVDVNAIYDTYSHGIVDAAAIKTYLAEQQKYSPLKYVLLVGGDSYDPMNYYGRLPGYPSSSPSFVPSLYTLDHFNFRAPSDQLYLAQGSLVAIGRLPVQNNDELNTVITKIVNLAHNNQGIAGSATFVADNGKDFDQLNDTLAASMGPGRDSTTAKVYADNGLSPTEVGTNTVNRINSGSRWINYAGHSGSNGWGLQTILRESDVQGLTNANPLVVVQWACYNAYYATPYSRGLAETWLTSQGGAGFVLGATNQGLTADQTELATRFYNNVFSNHMSLGQALAKAKADMLAAHAGMDDIANGYVIMGDPAATIN